MGDKDTEGGAFSRGIGLGMGFLSGMGILAVVSFVFCCGGFSTCGEPSEEAEQEAQRTEATEGGEAVGGGPSDEALEEPVRLSIESEVSDQGLLTIFGETNLPDEAELLVTTEGPDGEYSAQNKAQVQNGGYETEQFSEQGEPLTPGEYTVEVTMGISRVQPDSVRQVIGKNGEHLRGDLVERSEFGDGPFVEKTRTIEVPERAVPPRQAQAETAPGEPAAGEPAATFDFTPEQLMQRWSHPADVVSDTNAAARIQTRVDDWDRNELRDGRSRWLTKQGTSIKEIIGEPRVELVSMTVGLAADNYNQNLSAARDLAAFVELIAPQATNAWQDVVDALEKLPDTDEVSWTANRTKWTMRNAGPVVGLTAEPVE